jgi:hypothetical protein
MKWLVNIEQLEQRMFSPVRQDPSGLQVMQDSREQMESTVDQEKAAKLEPQEKMLRCVCGGIFEYLRHF